MPSQTRVRLLALLLCLGVLAAGCGASRSFGNGESAARAGEWDTAVEHYRRAVQQSPDNAEYKIALERAMLTASQQHLDAARIAEVRGIVDEALREYRRASEFDPPNRQIAGKVTELERKLRDQAEATAPRNNLQQLRAEAARQSTPQPLFNLSTVLPGIRFNNTGLREILNSIGMTSGVNVTYDNTFQDRMYTVQLDNVTLEEALNQILAANQLFYKVISPRSIIVVPDNVQKRGQYEEQAIRTFPISHADATELAQLINTIIRVGGGQVQPMVVANKTANTVTVRATTNVMSIIERIVEQNDNPRAEVVVDVQILEVNRSRTKQFGLDLGDYSVSVVFSPDADARGTTATGGNGTASTATTLQARPFNANTISRGVNTTDFYLAVPSAVIRFLETDSESKLIAKPQLRGSEGQKLTLNLGEEVPIPSTTFTPVAAGRRGLQPADLVHLPAGGRQRRDHAACHLRGRRHPRAADREQRARRRLEYRGPESAVVHVPQGGDQAASARRRVESAGRAAAGRRAPVAPWLPGHPATADHPPAVLGQRQRHRADRHRDAAHAAHRPNARAVGARSDADLHRHTTEPGAFRTAGAARVGSGRPGHHACTSRRHAWSRRTRSRTGRSGRSGTPRGRTSGGRTSRRGGPGGRRHGRCVGTES